MLEREFAFFQDNQDRLAAEYAGRYIVIVGDEVVGDYATRDDAYAETAADREVGTFLIQLAERGDDVITSTFHSRVLA